MATDLARMVQDCVAVLPSGAEVTFLDIKGTNDSLHERFLDRQDRIISKVLMQQTLTAEMEGKNNSQAAAATHLDVADGLASADRALVVDAFNEIAWLYTQVNVGGSTWAPEWKFAEAEDLNAKADLDKKLYAIGVRFTARHFTEKYGLQESEFSLASASEKPTQDDLLSEAEAGNFAAPNNIQEEQTPALQAQEILDQAILKILPKALAANEQFINQLEAAVKDAESFDAIFLALADLLSEQTENDELEEILAEAMTAAAGFGATAVHEESL